MLDAKYFEGFDKLVAMVEQDRGSVGVDGLNEGLELLTAEYIKM